MREWAKAGELVGVDDPPRSVAELDEQIDAADDEIETVEADIEALEAELADSKIPELSAKADDIRAEIDSLEERMDDLPERGMGLRIINACTDSLSYTSTEAGRYRFEFSIPADHDPWLSMLF